MSTARRWAEDFQAAWLAGDGEAAAALYAEDCVFRSHPFRELENARAYMRSVLSEAQAPEVWFGEPVEAGDTAAVEYWALVVAPDGTQSTLAGVHRMRFGAGGLIVEARDCWNQEPGHRRPPSEWGR
jgi:hypothetical protein